MTARSADACAPADARSWAPDAVQSGEACPWSADQILAAGRRVARAGAAHPPRVPYVTRWDAEDDSDTPVVVRRDGRGVAYVGERSFDREGGVLWTRTPSQPGRGRAELGKVHGLRQRLAMGGLLCQVCGGSADRNRDGVLWLIDADRDELRPDQELTAQPPVCVRCAGWSVRVCPHLGKGWTTVRVRSHRLWGVSGVLYYSVEGTPVAREFGPFSFGDPIMPWVVASQMIMSLSDFTVTASRTDPARTTEEASA